jgi:lysophosphatidic acid acyltransferase/lysophosphatidylinositol acyltransferase
VSWLLLEKFKVLGCSRGFAKSAIKFIPIIGWLFFLDDHIFLDRSFERDQKVIEHKISNYMKYPNNTWMFLPAEGTRFTKEKHETSMKFAKEKNIEPLKHHLIPRAGGFNVCIPLLKKYKCPAIYNFELAFEKNAKVAPKLGNLLIGEAVTAHIYLERIPMENAEASFEFLFDIFKKKDALQDSFQKFGNFYEGQGEKVIPGIPLNQRKEVLINTIVWVAIVTSMLTYLSIKLILAGKIFLLISISSVITILCE